MLLGGDCLEVLKTLPNNSVDSIVTDPPYGLSFMGKKWDYNVPSIEVWKEVIRVLKPGGHLLSFGGTRTYHRLACNIEDAGFEIRDQIQWLYGSGFPKSSRVNRMVDFCQCALGTHNKSNKDPLPCEAVHIDKAHVSGDDGLRVLSDPHSTHRLLNSQDDCLPSHGLSDVFAPDVSSDVRASSRQQECAQERSHSVALGDEPGRGSLHSPFSAQCTDRPSSQDYSNHANLATSSQERTSENSKHVERDELASNKLGNHHKTSYGNGLPQCKVCGKPNADGLGTALKPANEPIVLARKPLEKGLTVAQNVLKHGCGALNIDASRIKLNGEKLFNGGGNNPHFKHSGSGTEQEQFYQSKKPIVENTQGRWPSNCLLDETAARMLDAQSGTSVSRPHKNKTAKKSGVFNASEGEAFSPHNDSGGASRFFYVAKASKRERNAGFDSSDLIWESHSWESQGLSSLTENINQLSRDTYADLLTADRPWSTDLYGHSISEQYPKGMISTIETVLNLITELRTLSASQSSNTKENIQDAIRTIEMNGLSLAESVEFINQLDLSSIRDQTAYLLGVVRVVLPMLLQIKGYAKSNNFHATVKPIKLMEYLIRLITPPGGVVLDPFMGSGSTGVAAKNLGFNFIGIEREPEYLEIAKRRIEAAIESEDLKTQDEINQMELVING